MTPKELTTLAKTCRKVGIKYFKNDEVEFELQDTTLAVTSRRRRLSKNSNQSHPEDVIESDGWDKLTLEQQLNWSSDPLVSEVIAEGSVTATTS